MESLKKRVFHSDTFKALVSVLFVKAKGTLQKVGSIRENETN